MALLNREWMTTNDQDENITLAALLGGVWPKNPFMIELARKTLANLREFLDKVDDFVNAKDTLRALTAPARSKMEQLEDQSRKGTLKRNWEGGLNVKKGPVLQREHFA